MMQKKCGDVNKQVIFPKEQLFVPTQASDNNVFDFALNVEIYCSAYPFSLEFLANKIPCMLSKIHRIASLLRARKDKFVRSCSALKTQIRTASWFI
jgi:hypothetical protein